MPDETIFHITQPQLWADAQKTGRYERSTRGASLVDAGFIHCSFGRQVATVANFLYDDWRGELLLLEIDPALVDAEIRVENLDGGTDLFPHIYGPLDVDAVVATHGLRRASAAWAWTQA